MSQGNTLHAAFSNFPAWRVSRANAKALNGLQGGVAESFDAPVIPVA
ncbi:hypothetical protein [Micromonospora sp. NPDC007230]